ncbi:MAG: hypothetical protein MZV65_20270 [Chromatiales bacterium]|nr:hypothetical protein [Chromatiales bacterium]
MQPLNKVGDREGCRLENGKVTTPTGFKEAYDAVIEGGWTGLIGDPEHGGQGLPYVLGLAVSEMMASANMAFTMYPGLTSGAMEAHRNRRHRRAEGALPAENDHRPVDRHHEPDRAALPAPTSASLRTRAEPQSRRQLSRSPAPRSSSPPASTTWPRTSSTWCWRKIAGRARTAPRASACSSCPSSWSTPTAALGDRNDVELRRHRGQDGHPRQRHLRA